ncbi:S53 family peptidase [Longispora sp. NPDC051575]|uniref:S53 family peptidase n=1 Tax=Longispora sp. NPDC051575 TaxID=3154943 RepID=UPI003445ACBE
MRSRLPLLAGGLAAAAVLATGSSALAAPPGGGGLMPQQQLTVTLTLAGADEGGLAAYATAVSTPGSPAFGKHLTRAELRQRFGAPQSRVDGIVSWAKRSGFSVDKLDATGTRLTVTGSARALGAQFATGFTTRDTPSGKGLRTATATPAVPRAIAADVVAVTGLTERAAQPMSVRATASPKASKAAAGPNAPGNYCSTYWGEWVLPGVPAKYPAAQTSNAGCGINGAQLRGIYGLAPADTGAGQTVVITGAFDGGNAVADANKAFARNGVAPLAAGQLTIKKYIPGDGSDHGCNVGNWLAEQALDIQSVHTIAPAAKIVYAAAPDCTKLEETIAAVLADESINASIITNSWSYAHEKLGAEHLASTNSLLARATILGSGTYFSSGDYGDQTAVGQPAPTPVFPASSPWTTAVGGTTTGVSKTNSVVFSTGWESSANTVQNGQWVKRNPYFVWGAGGGTSTQFDQPTWQQGVAPAGGRSVPDVAGLADPNTGLYIGYSVNGQYREESTGGTSLAAPIIASLVAIAQARAGGEPVGLLAPVLYAKLAAGTPVTNDLTHQAAGILTPGLPSGERGVFLLDVDTTPQALHTTAGYDQVTGLGSPNAAFLSEITK